MKDLVCADYGVTWRGLVEVRKGTASCHGMLPPQCFERSSFAVRPRLLAFASQTRVIILRSLSSRLEGAVCGSLFFLRVSGCTECCRLNVSNDLVSPCAPIYKHSLAKHVRSSSDHCLPVSRVPSADHSLFLRVSGRTECCLLNVSNDLVLPCAPIY